MPSYEAWLKEEGLDKFADVRDIVSFDAGEAAEAFWKHRCQRDPSNYAHDALVCVRERVSTAIGPTRTFLVSVYNEPVFDSIEIQEE